MSIGFDNINDHVIPMDSFPLKWRFTDANYAKLPDIHLNQLRPLDNEAAQFLWEYIFATRLHDDVPFKKGFFTTIDKARISIGNEKDIKKWLYERGLPFSQDVYLSWQPDGAMIVPWKILIKYFDEFYYTFSDDLTVIDKSLNWALLFYHEDEIYFGTNKKFEPGKAFDDIDFIW